MKEAARRTKEPESMDRAEEGKSCGVCRRVSGVLQVRCRTLEAAAGGIDDGSEKCKA